MRTKAFWIPVGLLAAVALAVWGVWTWRLGTANRDLSLSLEAERQRNFADIAYHVEQIQSLMGKGLVTGTPQGNMRYMSEVHQHAQAAVANFMELPLPSELSSATGKFLQQTGDFANSLMRAESTGREMDAATRAELARLQQESQNLSAQLQTITAQYNQGGFRWNPPVQLTWATLWRGAQLPGKPNAEPQAPKSILPGGWNQVGTAMEKLPVMVYDGPFSDHVGQRTPATLGPLVERPEAERRLSQTVPNMGNLRINGVTDVAGPLPAYSFQLAPNGTPAGPGYTATAEITKHGGRLLQLLNSRTIGNPTVDLARARTLGQEYLNTIGYTGMDATYGQAIEGTATIAYALRENGMLIYPDQIKVQIALDTGEVIGVDARQYLMAHHNRTAPQPRISPQEAEERVNPDLQVQRAQLTMIPNQSGTGEILAYEFLTNFGDDTYLVYINAETGGEEQVLQQVETDGGTFAL